MKNTLVINLFGAPGVGKSTGAAYIFSKLKMKGIEAELVTEFAKDKVWEENKEVFKNQAYIFGKQSFKMSRCNGKVDVIVTDSPLLLSSFYNSDEVLGELFNEVVNNVFNSYNNINYVIYRTKPYVENGRIHTEEESDKIAEGLYDMLERYNVCYELYPGDIKSYDAIVDEVCEIVADDSNEVE